MKRNLSDQERSTMFSRFVIFIVAFGLIYVAASVGVMAHLVRENDRLCEYRQETIDTARQYVILVDSDFTVQDQALLDELFPKLDC